MITTIIIFIIAIHTIAKVKYTDIRNFIDFFYSTPFTTSSIICRLVSLINVAV